MLLYNGDVDVINEQKFRTRSMQLDELLRGDYRLMAAELRRATFRLCSDTRMSYPAPSTLDR